MPGNGRDETLAPDEDEPHLDPLGTWRIGRLESVSPAAAPETPSGPLLPPDTSSLQGGPLSVLEVLGHGGMGVVYRALQTGLQRQVALKAVRPGLEGSQRLTERQAFLDEALITARLEHPNVVPVYELQRRPDGELFLAMKLVDGKLWKDVLHEEKPDDVLFHLEVLIQLCNAVAFAHSRGIVHNDLKPGNVMLGSFGEVLLLDWGVAAQFEEATGDTALRHRSQITSPCGTPSYMAPELATGDGAKIGPHTDVYLLGAVLFEILTGTPPHGTRDVQSSLRKATAARHWQLPAQAPEELVRICSRALSFAPEDRYPSAQAFQQALRNYLRHRESLGMSVVARAGLDVCLKRAQAPGTLPEAARNRLYLDFAEAVAGFARARSLWEDNVAARRGQSEALLGYARAALCQGDLGLAQAQLAVWRESLGAEPEDAPAAATLEREISAELRRRARLSRGRRRLQLGLGTSLAALMLGLLSGLLIFRAQRETLRVANDSLGLANRTIAAQLATIDSQVHSIELERHVSELRGGIALTTLDSLSVQVQHQLIDVLGDPQSQKVARSILGIAIRGWQTMRDAELEAGHSSLGLAQARLDLARVLRETFHDREGAQREVEAALELYRSLRLDPDSAFQAELGFGLAVAELLSQLEGASDPAWLEQLLDAARKACRTAPEDPRARDLLARALATGSRAHLADGALQQAEQLAAESETQARACLELAPGLEHGNPLHTALLARAAIAAAAQGPQAARALLDELCRFQRGLAERLPDRSQGLLELAEALCQRSELLALLAEPEAALEDAAEALAALEPLIVEGRRLDPLRAVVGPLLLRFAQLAGQLTDEDAGHERIKACAAALRQRLGQAPESLPCRLLLADVLGIGAQLRYHSVVRDGVLEYGEPSQSHAREALIQVLELIGHRRRLRAAADSRDSRLALADALLLASLFEGLLQDFDAASSHGLEGWRLAEGVTGAEPDMQASLRRYNQLRTLGDALLRLGRVDEAGEVLMAARQSAAEAHARAPSDFAALQAESQSLWDVAERNLAAGDNTQAAELLEQALPSLRAAAALHPDRRDLQERLMGLLERRGRACIFLIDEPEKGRERLREAFELGSRLLPEAEPYLRYKIVMVQLGLAAAERTCGAYQEALEHFLAATARLGQDVPSLLIERGQLRLLLGDHEGALREFQRSATVDPTPASAVMTVLAGGSTQALTPHLAASGWQGALVAFALGTFDGDALLEAAGDDFSQLCEAHGLLGLRADLAGERAAALEHYHAAIQHGNVDEILWIWARDRLRQWQER